ncbi:hypothetical protein GSI01S_10_02030 [Gordonia sihwensis NBRC 108236]|uniref:Uncharacterized protein n=2 Tax=Gordoniaceae TaxID=85026 RepID=L7LIP9_9ACTN|nr:hypothetical protein CXX93_09165 [Gordonia sp. YC-JH1]GAC60611.1 hypothetical protein GSI01S_10_02030 [Gordonia sihwensis NBRC 108236]
MKATATRDQDNVHDGTVLVTQDFPDDQCVAVTILGRHDIDSDFPTIVVFDMDDLKAIADAYSRMKDS